jgi:uncharacterized membrane protein YhhN
MTPTAWLLLLFAAVAAVAGWYAVAVANHRLEYVAKPAVMVALIGVALALTPAAPVIVPWFVAALALSLVGDVALMLPRERFVGGLVAFLLAHMAYIVGLGLQAQSVGGVLLGLLVVGTVLSTMGRRTFEAVRRGHPGLLGPVAAYVVVISAMVVAAFATGQPLAMAGATLFYASDAMLAWNRFVAQRVPRPAVLAAYHVGQALLVLSLAGSLVS